MFESRQLTRLAVFFGPFISLSIYIEMVLCSGFVSLSWEPHANKALYRGHLSFLHPGDPVINHFDHGIIPTQWAYFTMGVLESCRWWSADVIGEDGQHTTYHQGIRKFGFEKNDPPINRYKNIEHQWTSINEHPDFSVETGVFCCHLGWQEWPASQIQGQAK